MKALKIYPFSGFGNYSHCWGWDDGLRSSLGRNAISRKIAVMQGGLDSSIIPLKEGIIEISYDAYGGSRNVSGFVIAYSKKEASLLLETFDETFPVVDYEED
jgi:putative component of toxin-antitoxin plasmid stabilization module